LNAFMARKTATWIFLVPRAGLAAVALLFCSLAAGAQGNGVIEGFVRDRQGKPQQNIVVTLKGGGGMQVDRTQTDHEGHYVFSQIGPGTYLVTPEVPSVPGEARRVEFVAGETGGHRREDFQMETAEEIQRRALLEPVFVQQIPAEAEKSFTEAQSLLRGGRAADGLLALERAVKQFPNYYEALNALGMEHLKHNDATKAGPAFQRALAVNRNSASARFGVGWAFYQVEKLLDAERELKEAVKLNPRVAETYWFLGMTQIELKQWPAAEQSFGTFRKLSPRDDRAMLHLYQMSIYDALGRYREAATELEIYLKAIPEKDRTQKLRDLLEKLKRKA